MDPCHYPRFLDDDLATQYFDQCKQQIPFQEMLWRAGRKLPRLVYRYDPEERQIKILNRLIKLVEFKGHRTVMGVFCNYYRNGNDYTPWHQDSYGADIFTLSLGATREFQMKFHNQAGVVSYQLQNGDGYYFSQQINAQMKHCIPKIKEIVGERISIVFFLQ